MAENDAVPDLSMNKAIKTELAEDEGPSSAQAESSSHIQNRRNLSDTLMSEFQRCLADQTFVDVRIYGGLTESVRCHKIVLAAFSSVIEAALADTDYDDETTVIIPDMTLDDLTAIVEFVYYRSMTLQAGTRPRPSLMDWLMQLKICGEEDVERALGLLHDQELSQEQKASAAAAAGCDGMGDVEASSAETTNKVAVIPASCDSARPFECDFGDACAKRFPTRHRLNLHRKQAHGVQPPRSELSCSECGTYRAKTREALEVHIRSKHSGERPFRCNVCGKAFAAKGYLDQHLDVHNADKVYPCPLCPKRFQSQPSLSQHKATHGQQGRTYQDPLSEGTAAPEKVKCGECGVLFATKRYLRQHVANKHSKRSSSACTTCEICGKVLSRKYELRCHMRTHTQERPFSCQRCPFTCRYRNGLMAHFKHVHEPKTEDTVPFACHFGCGRRFRQRIDLRKHERTHTLEKPFKCTEPDCGKAFARDDYRKKHMRMHSRKARATQSGTTSHHHSSGHHPHEGSGGIGEMSNVVVNAEEDISSALIGQDILVETAVALEGLADSTAAAQHHIELQEIVETEDQEEKRRAIYLISNQT